MSVTPCPSISFDTLLIPWQVSIRQVRDRPFSQCTTTGFGWPGRSRTRPPNTCDTVSPGDRWQSWPVSACPSIRSFVRSPFLPSRDHRDGDGGRRCARGGRTSTTVPLFASGESPRSVFSTVSPETIGDDGHGTRVAWLRHAIRGEARHLGIVHVCWRHEQQRRRRRHHRRRSHHPRRLRHPCRVTLPRPTLARFIIHPHCRLSFATIFAKREREEEGFTPSFYWLEAVMLSHPLA